MVMQARESVKSQSSMVMKCPFTGKWNYSCKGKLYPVTGENNSLYTSDMSNPLPLSKFVFKGKLAEIKLNNPKGIKSQWAPKGS